MLIIIHWRSFNSTGDFLFNVACLCLSLFTGGASILPKLRKIKIFTKIESKVFDFLHKRHVYKILYRNWKKISRILKTIDFAYEMISNPIRTSVVKILDLFSKDFKSIRIIKGYYDNFLTLIKDHTIGFTAFKSNILFLRKNALPKPKRKKSVVTKVNLYFKKHPRYLYKASNVAQKILWPGYKSKRRHNNKNTRNQRYYANVLYKGLNFIKNKVLKKF